VYTLLRVTPAGVTPLTRIAVPLPGRGHERDMETVLDAISLTDDGIVLGPHPDGAAVYARDGAVLRIIGVSKSTHQFPRGAISASGTWIAVTAPGGAVHLLSHPHDETRVLACTMSQVHSLRVLDSGTVLIGGVTNEGRLGLFAAESGGAVARLSEHPTATLSPDGTRVLEISARGVSVRLRGTQEPGPLTHQAALLAPLAKSGRGEFVDPTAIVVQTDLHYLAGVDLERVPATPGA
jgi:hypothetical protein